MPQDFDRVFGVLKPALAAKASRLAVQNAPLAKTISPQLKKHMQGKSCFNFKVPPDAEAVEELRRLTVAAADQWVRQKLI